jgi:hypothetical protein
MEVVMIDNEPRKSERMMGVRFWVRSDHDPCTARRRRPELGSLVARRSVTDSIGPFLKAR